MLPPRCRNNLLTAIGPSMNRDQLPPTTEHLLQTIAQRNMALPVLCLVASHRPLAFVTGQLLYLVAPLAALLGQPICSEWAALLSHPQGIKLIEERLTKMQAVNGKW